MQVKTITGESLPAALKQAKDEFGDDVILLESKNVLQQDNKFVQVTVSVPDGVKKIHPWSPPKIKAETPKAKSIESNVNKNNDFNKVITDILATKPQEMKQEKKILEELSELRKELNEFTKKSDENSLSTLPEVYTQIESRLTDKGIDESIAQNLIKRVYQFLENGHQADEKEVINGVKLELSRNFNKYEFNSENGKPKQKVVLLVGATGVGKSSAAMKLASHPEIYGKKDVVIVSTDLYGPSEALKAFAKTTGTTIYEGKQTDEIEGLLKKFKDKEVVILDTPGQSPFAPNHLSKLEEYIKVLKPTDIFLVLSMSTDLKDLFLASAVYLLMKPTGVVFTKFDETTQPGKVFSVLEELCLPAVSFSEGKRVFIDAEPANVDYLFNKLFEMA